MRKIYQDSIDLLRKSEKLALQYSDKGFYLAFSGGKDSQALYHIAKLAGVKFEAHMNFTSVDPPQVIRFVRQHYPDVICHAPEKSIFAYAVEKGILPSMRVRWCCAVLKEMGGAGRVTLTGVRKAESARRAKRKEVEVSNHKFEGDLNTFGDWQAVQIAKKMKNLNQDQFAETKESEIRCINGKDKIIINPILEWREEDVWQFLNYVVKVPHCELYDMGYSRIGCICCPMSGNRQKIRELKMFPHVKRNWLKAIKDIRSGEVLTKTNTCPVRGGVHPTAKALWGIGTERSTRGFGLDSASRQQPLGGFSGGLADNDRIVREATEDEIAENIFEWWISGKSYKEWYADTFLQLKLNFSNEKDIHTAQQDDNL